MTRKTRAELRDEKERLFERAEIRAWRDYVEGLSKIDDRAAAHRFADQGPGNSEPGGRFYHNLGCRLYGNPLDKPSAAEEAELRKLLERMKAKKS
jgi:hypothetical protein